MYFFFLNTWELFSILPLWLHHLVPHSFGHYKSKKNNFQYFTNIGTLRIFEKGFEVLPTNLNYISEGLSLRVIL